MVPRRGQPKKVLMDANYEITEASGKGKRGRPVYDEGASEEENMTGVAVKKRRGRPCKILDVEGSGPALDQSTKRGPGRPRKDV